MTEDAIRYIVTAAGLWLSVLTISVLIYRCVRLNYDYWAGECICDKQDDTETGPPTNGSQPS